MFTRRAILAAAALGPLIPLAAAAHDGHDLSQLRASVTSAARNARGLAVTLTLGNGRDMPVALSAVYSDLGQVIADLPLTLPAGGTAQLALLIEASDWPGIFTLTLDFGEAGLGPVTVIPL